MDINHQKVKLEHEQAVRRIFIEGFDAAMLAVHANAKDKGFWEEINLPEKIALMHSELSEALEALRSGPKYDEHCPEFLNLTIELADTVIRIMDFAAHLGLPLADAIIAKHIFNTTRPYKHNKHF